LTYSAEGNYPRAEAILNQSLEISRRRLGAEHPETFWVLSGIASVYQRRRQYAKAEDNAAQALAGWRHVLGPQDRTTMDTAGDLALAYVSQRRFTRAEPLAREALEFYRKKQPDDWRRFRMESLLGGSLAGQAKYAEAEPLLLNGYQGMVARKDRIAVPDWYLLDRALEWLVKLYEAWGKPEKAAKFRNASNPVNAVTVQ
jgi:tetratricopeptide (TPR) repeat protein